MNSIDRLPALAVALLSGLLAASCSCSDDVPAPKPGQAETTAPLAAEPAVSLPPRPSNLPPPPVVTVTEGTQTDGTATLKGTAFVSGRIPLRKEIVMDHVPGCKDHGPGMTENVIADDEGHLQNVICYVARGLDSQHFQPLPEEPVVLDQVGCTYEPHILLMRAGQTLVIKNTDKVRHNVNSRPERRSNQTFNQLMIRTTPDLEVVFEEQEVAIPIKPPSWTRRSTKPR